ncbi:MAG: SRPBCC domain-containing protein [Thermoanaerobaculia bacterium]|nr:SRPBCC domain-containing protein [Thermoanaerobaculia bacterium]
MTKTDATPENEDRKLELSIAIDAERDAVWQAISNAEGLKNWFPLDARLEPGEGGSVWLSWGPGCEGEAPLTIWEEGERLGWEEDHGGGARVLLEFRLDTEKGKSVVRLVQSGFSAGDRDENYWDDYFDATGSGWRYFLWNLSHYLERHPGKERQMVWTRGKVGLGRQELWSRLTEGDGLAVSGTVEKGGAFRLWTGDQGTFRDITEGVHLSARVADLDDALLLVEVEPGDEPTLGVWLSTYGLGDERVAQLQASLEAAVARL